MATTFKELLNIDDEPEVPTETNSSETGEVSEIEENPVTNTDKESSEDTPKSKVTPDDEVTEPSETSDVVNDEGDKSTPNDDENKQEDTKTKDKEDKPVEEPKPVTTETPAAPAPSEDTPVTAEAPATTETTTAPVTTETTTVPAAAPEVAPTPEKDTKEPKKESAIIEEMAGIIKKLDDKLTNVTDRLKDFEGKFTLDVPSVSSENEAPQEGTGSRKSVAVAPEETPEKRPAIEEPQVETSNEGAVGGENEVDPAEVLAQFTSAYREVYPQLNADDRTNYTTALRHLNQGEGTPEDTKTITAILRRF